MRMINTITTSAAVVTSLSILVGLIISVYKFCLKQEKQDEEIKGLQEMIADNKRDQHNIIVDIKQEQTLLCYGIMACLDGLEQMGCNHTVPETRNKFTKYLNQQAHKE